MPSINTIRTVTIRQVSEGADTVRRDLDGLVAAQERVAQASDQTATVTETSARRQLSAASALDKLRATADAAFRAQQQLERGTTTLDRAFAQGIVDSSGYDRVLGQLRTRFDEASAAAARLSTEQRAVARDTIAARDAAEAAARASQTTINARLGVSSGAGGDRVADFQAAADAADRLRAKLDPLYAAQRAYRTDLTELRGALSAGIVSEDAYTAALNRRKEAFTEQVAALGKISAAERLAATAAAESAAATDRATKGWAGLSAQGAAVSNRLDFNSDFIRKMSAGSGGAAVPANQNARIDFSKAQQANLLNLAQQAPDVFGSLYGGISPLTTFIQQGPQIAQSFAGPGALSMSGVFQAATDKASSLASRIGVLGGVFGALTATVGLGAIAWASYSSRQDEVERGLAGIGRASGVTRAQLNTIADANAAAARLSTGAARQAGTTFAGTGLIGPEMIGGLIQSTRDYAKLTGQDVPAAAQSLASAFADPAQGADELNKRLGFLNDTTRENIRRLSDQGDRLGAQRALFAAYRDSVTDAAQATSGWGRLMTETGNLIGDAWDRLGRTIDKVITGGTLDQQLADAQKQLSNAQVAAEGGFGLFSSKDVEDAQKNVTRLSALIDQRNAKIEQAQKAQKSLEVGNIIRSTAPDQQAVDKLYDSIEKLRKAVADPLKFDLDGVGLARAESAIGRLSRQWQTMADDVARYGTAATAALVRTAEFNNRTVGYTPYGRSAADIEKEYQDRIKDKGLDPAITEARVNAQYNPRLNDPNIDAREGREIVAAREAAMAASVREREGYQRTRDLELSTLRQRESLSSVEGGGALARLPAALRDQFLQQAAQPQFAGIPAAIAAAIAEREGSGRLSTGLSTSLGSDGRPSTSFGLGQINVGTARDAVRGGYLRPDFDRTNQSTMVQGIFGVLSMKRDAADGSLDKAIENYFGSPSSSANRDYAADIKRRAGLMGDASEGGLARDQDANTRAAKAAQDNLRISSDLYGKNGAQLESQTKATEQYNSMLARGVTAADAAAIAFSGLTDKVISAERATRLVQFTRDDDFAREQLGRDRIDQQAYAAARSQFRDTTSPEAQVVVSRTRDTLILTEQRSLFSDSITSFASELRRGGDAAAALSNTLGNVIDKLAGKAIDSLVGSAFSQFAGVGGSSGANPIGSFFSSIFGGARADGGLLYGPGGPRTDNLLIRASPGEYVINAEATARNRGLLDAINYGGHFADGGMISPGEARDLWSAASMPSPANANGAPPSITFVTPPGVNLEADGPAQRRSDGSYEQVLKTVEKGLGGRAANQRGPFQGAVGGAWARKG